jgi:hypothetical protein
MHPGVIYKYSIYIYIYIYICQDKLDKGTGRDKANLEYVL